MERYNYLEAIKNDILEYIKWEYSEEEQRELVSDKEAAREKLNDELWTVDSVTGNGSGSYTFNAYRAEEYIAHNLDILAEVLREFGCNVDILERGAEWCDVTIRCYLLDQAISEILNDLENTLSEEE